MQTKCTNTYLGVVWNSLVFCKLNALSQNKLHIMTLKDDIKYVQPSDFLELVWH